ncbi:MAG: hypothetical protein MAG453_00873 [Calditrichaeota bacterium]|nr:hypothetical protein [Calditrichota bacterium]
MGRRGEWFVALQFVLFVFVAVSPLWARMETSAAASVAGGFLFASGLVIGVWGLITLGRNLTPLPYPLTDNELVLHGPYKLVRHPIYSGVLLGALGYALLMRAPYAFAGVMLLVVLFDRKIRREEEWLVEKHPEYDEYRRRLPKLIPWLY